MPSPFSNLLSRLALIALAGLAVSKVNAQPARGAQLFEANCSPCHGPHGEGGKGPTLAQPSLPRAPDVAAITRIIKSGISGTEMPSFRIEPQDMPLLARFVKSLGDHPAEKVPGDSARGAQLVATKGSCLTCHSLHGQGGAIGPELTEIGLKRSSVYLRRALVDPGAEVPQSFTAFRSDISLPENFLFVRATTNDGQSVAGVRVNEDTFSIQIRDLAGQLHSYFKSDLAELHKDWGFSPMPPFGNVFTPDEMDDVVAYLVSLRGSPRVPATEKSDAAPATVQ